MRTRLRRLAHDLESVPPTGMRRWLRPAAVAATAILAAFAIWTTRGSETPPPTPREYPPVTHFADPVASPALSPDGRMVTFLRSAGTFNQHGDVYVKELPDGEPIQLTFDGLMKMGPIFSPDGETIVYTRIVTDFITMRSFGRPSALAAAAEICWTMSIPSTTRPNTVYWPCSEG